MHFIVRISYPPYLKLLFLSTLAFFFTLQGCSKKTAESIPPTPEKASLPTDKIPLTIPAGHKYISVVIDNDSGRRVRNLVKLGTAETLGGTQNPDGTTQVHTSWDGKDDKGNGLPPGKYTVRGVTVPEIDALYEYSFYNPGNPPWHGYLNSAWGSNHGDGAAMACVPAGVDSPWRAVVGFNGSEGTDCIIAIGKDDKKAWGFQTAWGNVQAVAIDGDNLYFGLGNSLKKINVKNGAAAFFKRPAGQIPQIAMPSSVIDSIAVGSSNIVAGLGTDPKNLKPQMVVMDKETGKTNTPYVTLTTIGKIGFGADETLYISDTNGFGKIDFTGVKTPVSLPEMGQPAAFTFDTDKNLYIFDAAPESRQVKVYSPDLGKLLRSVGRKGGQPKPQYDPLAFERLIALAVDDRGYLWTSEGMHPRRQAVWDKDGKLVKEFIGSTMYGNWDGKLHDQDSKLASIKNIILEVDPSQTKSYKVKQYIWSGPKPGAKDFLAMGVPFVLFEVNQLFRSDTSGKMHEYFLQNSLCQPVLYLQNEKGDYRPVAGMFMKWLPPSLNIFQRSQDPDKTMYVWSDLNGDEIITEDEIVVLPDANCAGWSGNTRITSDMTFYWNDYIIKPTRFTAAGAPVYEKSTITKMPNSKLDAQTNKQLTRVGKHFYTGRTDANVISGTHLWLREDGSEKGNFPSVGGGVFGSSQVPMPPKGQPIGELFIAGTVDFGGDQGSVMAIHGNYGQAYFFTEDGILIEDMFKDARDNPAGWGTTVERGKSMKDISMLQEDFGAWFGKQDDGKTPSKKSMSAENIGFGAWFGKQDDGKIRYCFGHTSANVVEVKGLDQFKRFNAGTVEIKPPAAEK